MADAASETLSLLEERLRRVQYVLHGHSDGGFDKASTSEVKGSATVRLRTLERDLQSLAAKSTTVSDILTLRKQYPELFHRSSSADASSTLPAASQASIVLAHSKLYQTISAQLPQVQEATIPDPAAAARLIELSPRILYLQAKQGAQARECAELRTRSARVVGSWYEGGVLGMGERWAEWEERLRDVEILVRRKEAAKKREEGAV